MADRTTAALFGEIFEQLAEIDTEASRSIARWLFPKRLNYDFSDYQMECDDALRTLGLLVESETEGE